MEVPACASGYSLKKSRVHVGDSVSTGSLSHASSKREGAGEETAPEAAATSEDAAPAASSGS